MKPKDFVEHAKRNLPASLEGSGFVNVGSYLGWKMFANKFAKLDDSTPDSGYLWVAINDEEMRRLEGYVRIEPTLTPHQNEGALFGDIFTKIKDYYNVR